MFKVLWVGFLRRRQDLRPQTGASSRIRRQSWPSTMMTVLSLGLLAFNVGAAEPSAFASLPNPPEVEEARVDLGRLLFYDTRLSGDTGTSCAHCHNPNNGWAEGDPLSHGYTGIKYFRNSPSLFNVWSRKYLMWDARLDGSDLGTAVRDMLTEAHTMNADSRIVQERLKQVPQYVQMFEAAFGPGDPYGGKIYAAVAEFLKTIRTTDAPFDRYMRGDQAALGELQLEGMKLFAGKAGCIACHSGPTLSDGKLHVLGVPDSPQMAMDADRQISMLRHYATMGVPNYMNLREDVGNYVVTKDRKDIARFPTPSLWDIEQTAPYMHSGVYQTLEQVVDFYDAGGGNRPNKSEQVKPLNLTPREKQALLVFLGALTGERPMAPVSADKTAPKAGHGDEGHDAGGHGAEGHGAGGHDTARLLIPEPELPAYQPRTLGKN